MRRGYPTPIFAPQSAAAPTHPATSYPARLYWPSGTGSRSARRIAQWRFLLAQATSPCREVAAQLSVRRSRRSEDPTLVWKTANTCLYVLYQWQQPRSRPPEVPAAPLVDSSSCHKWCHSGPAALALPRSTKVNPDSPTESPPSDSALSAFARVGWPAAVRRPPPRQPRISDTIDRPPQQHRPRGANPRWGTDGRPRPSVNEDVPVEGWLRRSGSQGGARIASVLVQRGIGGFPRRRRGVR